MEPLRVGRSYKLRFIGRGDHIISVGRDVAIWSIPQKKKLRSCRPFKHPSHVDVSPTGAHAVIKNTAGRLAIVSTDGLDLVVDVRPQEAIEGAAPIYSSCGTRIIDTTWNGLLRILDSSTGEVTHQEQSAGAMIKSMTCDSQRKLFAYVRQPKVSDRSSPLPFSQIVTRKWPFVDHPEVELAVGSAYVDSVSLNPEGSRLAMLQMNSAAEFSLTVVDLLEGCVMACRSIDPGGTNQSLAWSPDGSSLCCVEKGQVSICDSTSLTYLA